VIFVSSRNTFPIAQCDHHEPRFPFQEPRSPFHEVFCSRDEDDQIESQQSQKYRQLIYTATQIL